MRDLDADWRRRSQAERVSALMMLLSVALAPVLLSSLATGVSP